MIKIIKVVFNANLGNLFKSLLPTIPPIIPPIATWIPNLKSIYSFLAYRNVVAMTIGKIHVIAVVLDLTSLNPKK